MTADEILKSIVPDSLYNDPYKDQHIQQALELTGDLYGAKKNRAVALRAAHTLQLKTRDASTGGASGSIASKREGDLSIAFSSAGNTGDDLDQTSYGKQLQALMNSCIMTIGVTGGGC